MASSRDPHGTRPAFKITLGKGFTMTYPNGFTVSVQFGTMNQCDNNQPGWSDRPYASFSEEQRDAGASGCNNAEVAVIDSVGRFVPFEKFSRPSSGEPYGVGDPEVVGYCTPMDVTQVLACVASMREDDRLVPSVPRLPY